MANRFNNPFDQMFATSVDFLSGGQLFFYATGTSTPATTYADSTLVTPNTNPVVLDSLGRHGPIFLDPSVTYKVVLEDSLGVVIATADPIVDPVANVTAAFQVCAGSPTGQLAGNQGAVGGSSASVAWDITNHLLYVCTTTGTSATAVWSQVAAVIAGAVIFSGVISPAALAADQDDWAPVGAAAAHKIRISASAAVNLTGLAGGADGRQVVLTNVSTSSVTLNSENAGSTAANRFSFGWDVTLLPSQSISIEYDATSSRWRSVAHAAVEPVSQPAGRVTMSTGTAVLTGDVASSTSLFYGPYHGLYAPLWNGTNMMMASIEAELTLALDSNAAHTGYHQSGKNFDLFLTKDNKTIRFITGPAWTSDTARATALEYKRGFLCNAASMTAKYDATATTLTVPQDYGLYVGTVRMSADGTTKWVANPAPAAGGGNCQLLLWNAFNRVPVSAMSKDSTDSWSYGTQAWRAANAGGTGAGLNNRITAVFGLNEDAVMARYVAFCDPSTGNVFVAVGLDSTSAFSGYPGQSSGSAGSSVDGQYNGLAGQGMHFFQAIEFGNGGTNGFFGDNAIPLDMQMTLSLLARM